MRYLKGRNRVGHAKLLPRCDVCYFVGVEPNIIDGAKVTEPDTELGNRVANVIVVARDSG